MYNTNILSMSEELMDVLHKHPKYVRGIVGCTTQAFPGATIARLADFVSNGRINLKNINFVIVHVGTNNVTDFYRKV